MKISYEVLLCRSPSFFNQFDDFTVTTCQYPSLKKYKYIEMLCIVLYSVCRVERVQLTMQYNSTPPILSLFKTLFYLGQVELSIWK